MPTEAMGQAVPGFSKAFAPDSIAPDGTSTLTFTIDNTGTGGFMGNGSFTDTLPDGMTVAATPNVVNNCPGGLITANAGSGTITANFLEALPGTTCTITVDVTATATGVNLTGDLTSTFGNSGTATATLTVISVEAMDDSYSGAIQGNPFTVDAPGPLANDTGATSAIQASSTAFGILDFSSDGSFTYTPGEDFAGTDSFTYRASDGTSQSNLATVTITGETCTFTVDRNDIEVPAEGGEITAEVMASNAQCVWQQRTEDNWIDLPWQSNQGSRSAVGDVRKNSSFEERVGILTVAGYDIAVTQRGRCFAAIEQATSAISAQGGEQTFEVVAGDECSWDLTQIPAWISIEENSQSGVGPGTVTYSVEELSDTRAASPVARTGTILIRGPGGRDSRFVVVQQVAGDRPNPPTRVQLELKEQGDERRMRIKFTETNAPETHTRYQAFRLSRSNGPSGQVGRAKRNSPLIDDPLPLTETNACWRVSAQNESGASVWSMSCWREGNIRYLGFVTDSTGSRSTAQGDLPPRSVARIYSAYRPWGDLAVESALEIAGWELGQNLFIHPVTDLANGVPGDTSMVIVPSASRGDLVGQVRHVNGAQAELRRFARDGGSVLLHRWSDGERTYRAPVKGAPTARLGGYEEYRLGAGRFFITTLAVDHPDLEEVHHLDELLARLAAEYESEAR